MSAPKEVWLSSDGILFKSVSINAYRAQVHSEDVRYVLAESVEAETASLRAQLAEARAGRDEAMEAWALLNGFVRGSAARFNGDANMDTFAKVSMKRFDDLRARIASRDSGAPAQAEQER